MPNGKFVVEVAQLEPEGMRAIMTIEEDETFKIDEEDADPEVLAKLIAA